MIAAAVGGIAAGVVFVGVWGVALVVMFFGGRDMNTSAVYTFAKIAAIISGAGMFIYFIKEEWFPNAEESQRFVKDLPENIRLIVNRILLVLASIFGVWLLYQVAKLVFLK